MQIETISIIGTGEWNEDALIVNERLGLYGVLDGATSLVPFRGPNGETGGYLASRTVKRHFDELEEAEGRPLSLQVEVARANRLLREEMVAAGIDPSAKEELWTTGIALVRIHDRYVEYVQAADCMLIAVETDGSIRIVTRDQVAYFDDNIGNLWREGRASGLQKLEELKNYAKPYILSNKKHMNTLDGYSVLNGDPAAEEMLEYGRINRIRLKGLLLMTDGLFLPNQEGEKGAGLETVAQRIVNEGLGAYVDWLLMLEEDDANCERYPRFKQSDDKTAIWIGFS
ncbi:hypothetical protein J31TS4_43780 [Paenibacillus sp. J31TS4]|uniref:protein phosphatase 2C domain-containing protein n=1 Tax=Paenibacillus sp. J31TS4 TaxID=2807195 RepID=UPI001B10821A|nr:protein phosphatase 2C domain-containing protein [Paenibacillus sp. J31TS4]GIP41098.1 hypothetical protein J31TS4_43780 [Paenibacillus sp. J31TS4]